MEQHNSQNVTLHLRGMGLVLVVGAWLAGILVVAFAVDTNIVVPAHLFLVGTGLALAFLAVWFRNVRVRFAFLLLFCLCAGGWRYTSALPANDPLQVTRFIGSEVLKVRGNVVEEPEFTGRARILTIEVQSAQRKTSSSWEVAHGTVRVQVLGSEIEDAYGANYGDQVELQGKLQTPRQPSTADILAEMPFPRVHVLQTDDHSLFAMLYSLRVHLAHIIEQSLPQPTASLLVAIFLGLRTPALKPLIPDFNTTGTAHLIVPSGFKVTLLAGIVHAATRWLYEIPVRTSDGTSFKRRKGRWWSWCGTGIIVLSIAVYTVLSGTGPAAIRAGIMGILLVSAPRLGRIYNIYTALAFSALLMSLYNPFILWNVGFQLSFLGTLGIVLFTPYIQRFIDFLLPFRWASIVTETIAVTLAAQIATLPIFASAFQQVSLIAPLANLLTVPLLGSTILLGLLLCLCGLIAHPLAFLFAWIAWPLLTYMLIVVKKCASLPLAWFAISGLDSRIAWAYYVLLAVIVSLLFHYWPSILAQKRHEQQAPFGLSQKSWWFLRIGIALLIVGWNGVSILLTPPLSGLRVTFLNVGPASQPAQGEAILVRTAHGKTMLIDGGLDAVSLSQALDTRLPSWQRFIDVVVLTCPLADHLTGLQDIVSRYTIGEVLDGGMLHPSTTYARWQRTIRERALHYAPLTQGESISLDTAVELQVLWPGQSLHKGSNEVRDNGLILRLVAPGLRLLLLGASAQSTYALTNMPTSVTGSALQADIVQFVVERSKGIPTALTDIIQQARPSLLVATPAALPAKQRQEGTERDSLSRLVQLLGPTIAVVQTAQSGACEVLSNTSGWTMYSET